MPPLEDMTDLLKQANAVRMLNLGVNFDEEEKRDISSKEKHEDEKSQKSQADKSKGRAKVNKDVKANVIKPNPSTPGASNSNVR